MSILIALAAAAAPMGSVIVTPDDRREMIVGSADLDLTHTPDARRFQRRVAVAATRVCAIDGRTLSELKWRDACLAETARASQADAARVIAAARTDGPIQLTAR